MIKISSIRLILLASLLVSTGIITSCKKDDNNGSGEIQLINFGPTGAKHGDTLRFFGSQLDKVTSVSFTGEGATVAQAEFIQQTNELILLKVPANAVEGFVTLQTPEGDIVSRTRFNLSVSSTITTMTLEARPGGNITLTGEYLNWVRRVTFNSDKVVTTFVSQSMNELVVTVPEDAQTGPLVLFFAGTDSSDVRTEDTLTVTLPVATSISPNPVKHQTDLTITGTNLDLVKQVLFTGVPAPVTVFVSQTATQIVIKVPASASKGKISLVAASGVATQSAGDLDVSLPEVSLIAPNPIDPGANLTITGTNLDLVTSVSFVGAAAAVTSFVSQSATELVVAVPAGTLKGKLTLGVLNSTIMVETPQLLELNGGLPPLADFTFPIYTDGLHNPFQDWSFTDTHDFNSTAVVRQGTKSILAVYAANGYQGITFYAPTEMPTAGYTILEFSVYADASMDGKKLQVVTNDLNNGLKPQVTIVGGEWTTFNVTLQSMGGFAGISRITLQAVGFTGTIHIDHVGWR
ncbi:MAG: IPT/TIG domain-containing protein [Chitinophagaceae bacterium]